MCDKYDDFFAWWRRQIEGGDVGRRECVVCGLCGHFVANGCTPSHGLGTCEVGRGPDRARWARERVVCDEFVAKGGAEEEVLKELVRTDKVTKTMELNKRLAKDEDQ